MITTSLAFISLQETLHSFTTIHWPDHRMLIPGIRLITACSQAGCGFSDSIDSLSRILVIFTLHVA